MTIIKRLPFEAIFWVTALCILALFKPGQTHVSICPLAYLGFDFCPGCGLGAINLFTAAWRIISFFKNASTWDIWIRCFGSQDLSTHQKSIQTTMAKVIMFLPELTGEEMVYVQKLIADYGDEKAKTFATVYRSRRKDPQLILILALLGFVFFAGIHRMIINQVGMGILFLLTCGFCFVGTIVDLVNYQKLAFEFNSKQADEVAVMI